MRVNMDAAKVKKARESEGIEAEPEPPRKRRRRRGIRDRSLTLNDDIMAIVLPYLAKTSPRHLFMMSMLNSYHNTLVIDAHEIWKDLFKKWESRRYSTFCRSQGSDYAARSLSAIPRWMVPPGNYWTKLYFQGVRAFDDRFRVPNDRSQTTTPRPESDWRDKGVPLEKQEEFGLYARKCLALVHIGCCGMCGTRQGQQRPVWSLNMRICRGCWLDNIVSHRTLQQASPGFYLLDCGIVLTFVAGLWCQSDKTTISRRRAAVQAFPEACLLHTQLCPPSSPRATHAGPCGFPCGAYLRAPLAVLETPSERVYRSL